MSSKAPKKPNTAGAGGLPAQPAPTGFLSRVKVCVPDRGIPFGQVKAKAWQASVPRHGGGVTADPAERGITHILVGPGGIAALPPRYQPQPPAPTKPPCAVSSKPSSSSSGAGGAPAPSGSTTSGGGGAAAANAAAGPSAAAAAAAGTGPATVGAAAAPPQPPKAQQPVERLPPQQPAAAATAASGGKQAGTKRRAPSAAAALQDRPPAYVDYTWIERCLAERRVLDAAQFAPAAPKPAEQLSGKGASGASTSSAESGGEVSMEVQMRRRWLGEEFWRPECAEMSLSELALQTVYSEERSARLGNEGVVLALKELASYERACQSDYFKDEEGETKANFRALRYSRAASIVRGCSYKLEPLVRAGQLPWVGEVIARQVNDILTRGTCQELEDFRSNKPVSDSMGVLRADSAGAATRAAFRALPGVGAQTAKHWWDLGLKSFEDVDAAAQPGGPLAPSSSQELSVAQRFCLEHRADLLEGTTAEEVQELHDMLEAALRAVSGPGWRIELVGGQARSRAHHDADLLITHPTQPIAGVVTKLVDHLVKQGRLMPQGRAFCMVQSGRLKNHIDKLKAAILREPSAAPATQQMDRFDHIYGIVCTKGGKYRRMDIIIVPFDEIAWAVVGWIGSRQYNRFLRQHAKDLGCLLTSHGMMRKVGNEVFLVPDEKPPLNRAKQECWPPGWGPGRRVQTCQDVFELLQVPYRDPPDRNAP